jgi:hypothetical protein
MINKFIEEEYKLWSNINNILFEIDKIIMEIR